MKARIVSLVLEECVVLISSPLEAQRLAVESWHRPPQPVFNTGIPLPRVARTALEERSGVAPIQEGRPSLATHIVVGAVIGGVAGYLVATARTSDSGTEGMIPDELGYAFGAAVGALAGGAVGALVYAWKVDDESAGGDPSDVALRDRRHSALLHR